MAKSIKLLILTVGFLALGLAETLGGQIRFVGGGMPAYRPAIAFRSMPMMRQMPGYRPAPVMRSGFVRKGLVPRQNYVQGFNREPTGRGYQFGRAAYDPSVFQGIRPGRMTVVGRSGLHPVRNQTKWATIPRRPGLVFTNEDGTMSDEGSLDIEQMIDDTDLSTPIEPLSDCIENCVRGAVAIANDGATGSAWNYPTWEAARDSALNFCASGTTIPCLAWATAAGSQWVAAVYCEISSPEGYTILQQGVTGQGNDLAASIRNAFRIAVSGGTFTLDQCVLRAFVAANGAQTLIDQPEPIVADNPAPTSQPPVIEQRSVAKDSPKPADGPMPSSYWTFYGSDMYMTKNGSKRAFFFGSPRSGLADLGIGHGSPFFEGSIDGSTYRGDVFAYAKNCPSMSYPVVGRLSADEKHIMFVGDRPSRDDQCNVIAMKKVTISFDFNRGAEVTSAE